MSWVNRDPWPIQTVDPDPWPTDPLSAVVVLAAGAVWSCCHEAVRRLCRRGSARRRRRRRQSVARSRASSTLVLRRRLTRRRLHSCHSPPFTHSPSSTNLSTSPAAGAIRDTQGGMKGLMPPKLSKLDITTDVANLVNVHMWLWTCNSAVYYMGILHLRNDIFVTDIIGYDRLKFS